MKRRQLAGWLTLLCLTATGCAGGNSQDAVRAQDRASSGASAVGADLAQTPADGTRSDRRKPPRYRLPGKFKVLAIGGDGVPICVNNLESLPPVFATSPSVWMSQGLGPKRLVFTYESALCLHGFSADSPVTVTVSDGRRHTTTTVQPTAGELAHAWYEPAESLFNGKRLRAYGVGSGVVQTETWDFVPPSATREILAATGHITITATQSGNNASYRQTIAVPEGPNRAALRGDTRRRLVVSGFPRGATVPIGLYRLDRKRENATFVRSLGVVVMPRSRTAVFTVPRSAAGTAYCVTVPLELQSGCPLF
jgi:hypothetical protein